MQNKWHSELLYHSIRNSPLSTIKGTLTAKIIHREVSISENSLYSYRKLLCWWRTVNFKIPIIEKLRQMPSRDNWIILNCSGSHIIHTMEGNGAKQIIIMMMIMMMISAEICSQEPKRLNIDVSLIITSIIYIDCNLSHSFAPFIFIFSLLKHYYSVRKTME